MSKLPPQARHLTRRQIRGSYAEPNRTKFDAFIEPLFLAFMLVAITVACAWLILPL